MSKRIQKTGSKKITANYNPNHDEQGRFAPDTGGGSGGVDTGGSAEGATAVHSIAVGGKVSHDQLTGAGYKLTAKDPAKGHATYKHDSGHTITVDVGSNEMLGMGPAHVRKGLETVVSVSGNPTPKAKSQVAALGGMIADRKSTGSRNIKAEVKKGLQDKGIIGK